MRQRTLSAPRTQQLFSRWLGLLRLELRYLAIASYNQKKGDPPPTTPFVRPFNHSGQPINISSVQRTRQHSTYWTISCHLGRLSSRHHIPTAHISNPTTKPIIAVNIAHVPAFGATKDNSINFILHVTLYHLCIGQHGIGGRTSICQGTISKALASSSSAPTSVQGNID